MKRILLITNHVDDVYCFRKELIEAMIKKGYEVIISCPFGDKLDLMHDIPFLYDNILIDRRGKNPVKDFKLFIHYYNLIQRVKPDFVLTYTIKPNIYAGAAARLLNVPYIINITGLGSIHDVQGFSKFLIIQMMRFAFRKARMIFFQNAENMKIGKEMGLIHGECKLIPGSGVNVERFNLQQYPDNSIIVFNYIGRIMKEKGIDDYLKVAEIIKKSYPNTEFNIIGFIEPTEYVYKEKLIALEKRNIILYRGSQNDVRPFITRGHATIHPSCYGEGMSNVLLESASSGRPLITTDIAGCREIVEDGVSGFIYHKGNTNDLIACIEKFLSISYSEKMKMGLKGREHVKNNFSRDKVIASYLSVIEG